MSFSCTALDCTDEICATQCNDYCGGDFFKYGCRESRAVCECSPSTMEMVFFFAFCFFALITFFSVANEFARADEHHKRKSLCVSEKKQ